MQHALSWVEVSEAALAHNVRGFRHLIGAERKLMVVVKADAYGHGMALVARAAKSADADWLAVFNVDEAFTLREAGVDLPVLVMGPTPADALPRAAAEEIRVTVAGPSALEALLAASSLQGLRVHLKLEAGTNRQGFMPDELEAAARLARVDGVELEGAYTHFADIEDTTDHSFARAQLKRFEEQVRGLRELGVTPPVLHTACSAAALLFEPTYFDLVRVGISAYGLWPSKETLVSVRQSGREPIQLEPAMTWKTRIAQIKEIPAGETVGYGRTHKTTHPTLIAVLPVGYANGYDRHLSNRAHVLVRGQRARLVGRVMMNMIVVDVTDVPDVIAGDEVVLLGAQGDERVTAEELASWIGTINYEVVTRIEPGQPRVLV